LDDNLTDNRTQLFAEPEFYLNLPGSEAPYANDYYFYRSNTMDVFLMIRRKKTTIFLDAKENTKVSDLKRMIEGITKKPPPEQRLYNKDDAVIINYYLLIRRVKR
jgi:hypothetical protein